MKKFYTFAVMVLMVSLSFGTTANFNSLSVEEMEKEFYNMPPAQWTETIKNAIEAKNGNALDLKKDMELARVLKAASRALNSFSEDHADEVAIELIDNCPFIIVQKRSSTNEYIILLAMWDQCNDSGIFVPIEYKTSTFLGKITSISKDAAK